MRALVLERIQVQRQCGDQRLAFTSAHLGDASRMEHRASKQLHIVVTLTDRSARGLAYGGECLGEQVVQRLTRKETAAEFGGLVAQRVVGERLVLGLERVDLVNEGPQF